jgi:hypothetical protein
MSVVVAAPAPDNTDIWGYGSRRGGRDDIECVDANFQTLTNSAVIARLDRATQYSRDPSDWPFAQRPSCRVRMATILE